MVAVGTAVALIRLSVVSLAGALPFLVSFGVSSICSTVSSASPLSEVSEDSADLEVSSLSIETLADTSTSSRFSWESSFESSTRVLSPSSLEPLSLSTLVLLLPTTTGLMMKDSSPRVVPDRISSSLVVSSTWPDSGLRRGLPIIDWEKRILFLTPGVVLVLLAGSLASQSCNCLSNLSRDLTQDLSFLDVHVVVVGESQIGQDLDQHLGLEAVW